MNTNLQDDAYFIEAESIEFDDITNIEQLFCIGNGHIVQQGNFDEYFSGTSHLGSFVSGLDLDAIKMNENWKSAYDTNKQFIVNAPDWTSIVIRLNEEMLDLHTWELRNFKYVLNLQNATVERSFEAISAKAHHIEVKIKKFLSLANKSVAAICYSIKSINFEGRISFMPLINADNINVINDINELTWNVLQTRTQKDVAHVWTQIRRLGFHICSAISYSFFKNNGELNKIATKIEKEKIAGYNVGADVKSGDTLKLHKYIAIVNSLQTHRSNLTAVACETALAAKLAGWNILLEEHVAEWNAACKSIENEKDALALKMELFKTYQIYK